MGVVTLVSIVALGWKVVDWFKYLTNRMWRPAITQVFAWVVMIVGVFLFAQSDFSTTTVIGNTLFEDLNGASLVLLGMMYGSLAGVGVSVVRALDGPDSASTPSLVPRINDPNRHD